MTEGRSPSVPAPRKRNWLVLGPMGTDHISYDPPDIEYAERFAVDVEASSARGAVKAAYDGMGWRSRNDLFAVTRFEGRNPFGALRAIAYPVCAEFGEHDGCPDCVAFDTAVSDALTYLKERYE